MKIRMLRVLILAVVAACSVMGQVTVSTTSDGASREDILKLFDVMQVRSQMKTVMSQVMLQMRMLSHEQLRRQNPNITQSELEKVDGASEQLIKDMPVEGMLDDMVPVYQKHLTKTDVNAMIAFYSTPTGQKILREMPAITTEGMQALQPRLLKQMDETMRKAQEMAQPGAAKQTPASPAPKN
jgi:uncharacterized protein